MNQKLYRVPANFADGARINPTDHPRLYAESIQDPAGFGVSAAGSTGSRISRMLKTPAMNRAMFASAGSTYGTLNVASNCLDRHLQTRGDKTLSSGGG